jgi:predicted signal transduction protein with EAL and GGDEF domain
VVEGIETAAELRHVRELGCQVAQGFHLARPMPAYRVEELILEAPFLISPDGFRKEGVSNVPALVVASGERTF